MADCARAECKHDSAPEPACPIGVPQSVACRYQSSGIHRGRRLVRADDGASGASQSVEGLATTVGQDTDGKAEQRQNSDQTGRILSPGADGEQIRGRTELVVHQRKVRQMIRVAGHFVFREALRVHR